MSHLQKTDGYLSFDNSLLNICNNHSGHGCLKFRQQCCLTYWMMAYLIKIYFVNGIAAQLRPAAVNSRGTEKSMTI